MNSIINPAPSTPGRILRIVPCLIASFLAAGQVAALERVPLAGPDAHQLPAGASTSFSVAVPTLSAERRGVAAVDVYGTLGSGNGQITLQAVDPVSSAVLASTTTAVVQPVPTHPWSVICSSDTRRGRSFLAFDGHMDTIWGSELEAGRQQWIGVEFATPTRVSGLNYIPHTFRSNDGVARRYRVEIRRSGGGWLTVANGERPTNTRTTLEVPFPGRDVVAIRFVIETDWSGAGYGSAARIELPGVQLDPVPVQSPTRAWLELPPQVMGGLSGKSFELRVLNTSQIPVAIGAPRARFDVAPTANLVDGYGGAKIGAGLLGFDTIYEDNRNILTVRTVRPGTPAAEQQMAKGDVILAVRGRPLSFNNISRGWEWFDHSHETIIGRETEAALQAGETSLPLTLLRDGVAVDIQLPLARSTPFTTMNPTHDPEAARMLGDCLDYIARTQNADGSWPGRMMHTTFSALALLATGQPDHLERVHRAVRWTQARFRTTEAYGHLAFWDAAYAGMLYGEWHLATGDTSVLPNLHALRDWTVGGAKMSRYGILALGHDPGGLPYSSRGLVAPACHLLVVESLAMRAGVGSSIWEMILPYMERSWSNPAQGGHGALGYYPDQKDNSQHWSRSGLFSMAAHLRGERHDMRDAMIESMHTRHPWLRNSHAYGEPGGALGLLALNLVAPGIYDEVIRQYDWWFSLAWEPGYGLRYTTPHMGSPYMGEDRLLTPAYALVLQSPRRTLHLTGLPQTGATPINWAVYNTTSPSDVRTEGELVASYTGHNDGMNYTLNGVTFQSGRIPGMPNSSLMPSNRQPQGVTGDYKAFLSRSSYGSNTRTITFDNLVPGQRYLVQVWYADEANGGASARLDRNTSVEVDLGDTGVNQAGQYAIGTFMANASQQTFTVRTWRNGSATSWAQINGMQVRRMVTPFVSAPIEWTVHDTAGVSDVSTEGTLVAAYTGHDDGINYTLNGVTFQSGKIPGMPSSSVMSGSRQPQGVTGDYKAFLARSSYGSNTRTVALTGLTVGERYQVQVWYADDPTGTSFQRIDGGRATLFAQGSNNSGQYAIGTFTADATTRTFTSRTWSAAGESSWSQINGLQVRRIAPAPFQFSHTVTYHGNDNTSGVAPVDGASPYGANALVSVLTPGNLSRTGHVFTAWGTSPGHLATKYAPGANFMIGTDTTLYAQWRAFSSADYSWNTTNGIWSAGANWSDHATTGGTTGTVPSVTDRATFHQSDVNGASIVDFDAAAAISGLTFRNTGTTLLRSDSTTARTLTIDSAGITITSGAGAVTLGNATNILNLSLSIGQSWSNNSTSLFTVVNNVANGGNLLTSGGMGNTTVGGVISGTGGFTKNDGGTLTLNNRNTFTGGTSVNGGTLMLGSVSGGTGTIRGTLTVNAGATVDHTVANTFGYTSGQSVNVLNIVGGTVGGANLGNHFWNNFQLNMTGGTLHLGGSLNEFQNPTVTVNTSAETARILRVGSSAVFRLRDGTSATFNVADGAQDVNLLIDLPVTQASGTSGITKTGAGTMALTAANSYLGDTIVSGGTLSLGNGTANSNLSDLAAVSIAAGATLHLNFTGSDTIGKLIIDGERLAPGTYNGSLSTPEPYRSYFSGTGSLTVPGGQNGIWTSAASGTWSTSGNWASNAIATGFDHAATFSARTSGSITVTLDTPRAIGNLAFSYANYTLAGANTLTLDVASTATPAISVAARITATVSATLAGTQGLEKTGTGTLTLSGANTYSGTTTISAGTLAVTGAGRITNTADISVAENATFRHAPTTTAHYSFTPSITGSGTVRIQYGGTHNFFTDSNLSGFSGQVIFESGSGWIRPNGNFSSSAARFHLDGAQVNLNGNPIWGQFSGSATALVGSSGGGARILTFGHLDTDATYAGNFNSVPISLVKEGTGTQAFTGTTNLSTGTITINGGTIEIGGAGRLNSGAYAGNIAARNTTTFHYNSTANQTLSGVISGAGVLAKSGSGTLTLANTNSYTGATHVNAGTLLVNGSQTNATGDVTVETNATLGGIGVIGGNITVKSGGTLAPGVGIGTLSTWSTVTLEPGAVFAAQIGSAAATADQIFAFDNLTITGALLSLSDIAGTPAPLPLGTKLTLIDYGDFTLTGTFNGLPEGSTVSVGINHFTLSYIDAGKVTLTASAVDFTWTGTASGDWGDSANWDNAPTFIANNGIIFHQTGAGNLANTFFTEDRTIGSITFNANATSDVGVRLADSADGTTGRTLTLGSESVAPTITVASEASGNFTIGNSAHGAIALANHLTVNHNGSGSLTLGRPISGTGFGITKTGGGILRISNTGNSYTGNTIISNGNLALGISNVLPNASNISIGSATLDAATFTDTAGTLAITGAATVNLGSGGALAFADSSADTWTGTLNITGDFVPGASIRFGTTSAGLTSTQLANISVNGSGVGTYTLDANGYLTDAAGSPYDTWSGGADFDADANGDGVKNGLAWVLGAPNVGANAHGLLPTLDNSDPTFLIFNFRRKDEANTDDNTQILAQFGTNLAAWTDAVDDGDEIIITPTADFHSAGVDKVEVKIKRSLAPGGKLFVRLFVENTP